MSASAFQSAVSGRSVLVNETHVESLQLVGRIGHSAFLVGGTVNDGGTASGPNPYDLLAASLAVCTVMTVRLSADRKKLSVRRGRNWRSFSTALHSRTSSTRRR